MSNGAQVQTKPISDQQVMDRMMSIDNPIQGENVRKLAAAIYGEAAGVKDDKQRESYMILAGSSFVNRVGKKEWRNKDFDTLMDSTFSAVKFSNQPYKEAMSGKVPKSSKPRWDQAMRIANGLMSGGINPVAGQFYFTEDEINKMKGKKSFDFSIVKDVGTIGKYKIFSY
jgi:hypothetical protein|tara:strand:+ start:56 stop:565 length:510 start_codon:yes stop_codon:yes gene_type:complete